MPSWWCGAKAGMEPGKCLSYEAFREPIISPTRHNLEKVTFDPKDIPVIVLLE